MANLAYQLDCLADVISCSQGVFRELWKPSWTAADDAALDVWRAVRRRYSGSMNLVDDPKQAQGRARLSYGGRVRAASLEGESIDDYMRSLALLLLPGDAAKLRASFEHFRPRFLDWWTARGRAIVAEPFPRFAALLADEHVAALVDRAAHFYVADLPVGTDVWFDLIARPVSTAETNRTAEASDNHLVIEVVAGESVEERMPVAVHELCHFFYGSRTAAAQARLNARFATSPDPLAAIAYGLLNESLATLLGNVVLGRAIAADDTAKRLARDNGLYVDRNIDRTTKALAGDADAILAGTLDDDAFTVAYLRAVHRALGDAPAPAAYLREFILAYTPTFETSGERFIRQTKAESVFGTVLTSPSAVDDLTKNPRFTVVMMLSSHDLPAFDTYAKSLGAASLLAVHAEVKRGLPFAYVFARPPHAMVFALVADDATSMDTLADTLVARGSALDGVMRLPAPPASR